MTRLLLTALFSAASMWAGIITTETCQAQSFYDSQSDPASASCAAEDNHHGDSANASGTVSIGSFSGFVDAWSGMCCPIATASSSFDEMLTVATTLTWDIFVGIAGPWGQVFLNLGPLSEGYLSSWSGVVTETLGPGTYMFSSYAYVSDQGSASFTANDPQSVSEVPEPSTFGLAAVVLFGLGKLRRPA